MCSCDLCGASPRKSNSGRAKSNQAMLAAGDRDSEDSPGFLSFAEPIQASDSMLADESIQSQANDARTVLKTPTRTSGLVEEARFDDSFEVPHHSFASSIAAPSLQDAKQSFALDAASFASSPESLKTRIRMLSDQLDQSETDRQALASRLIDADARLEESRIAAERASRKTVDLEASVGTLESELAEV